MATEPTDGPVVAVEGIAAGKFFGFLVMIPVAALAVVPAPYQHLAGVFPAY